MKRLRMQLYYLLICSLANVLAWPDLVAQPMSETDSLTMPLYSKAVPNTAGPGRELVSTRPNGTRFIRGTTIPTLTYFQPEKPVKQAVIVCPGGGYSGVAIDKEGFLVARAFQEKGIHAFVLKYRTPLDSTCIDKSIAPIQDAQQAMKIARDSLSAWGYDDVEVGIMGFSAGGHLASFASNAYEHDYLHDKEGSAPLRPDFSILIYPVITFDPPHAHMGSRRNLLGSSPTAEQVNNYCSEKLVNAKTPPVFLVHASDDKSVPVQNSLLYYEACAQHDVPAEMHIYPYGGHGFGMYNQKSADDWMGRLFNWLKTL